MAKLLDRFGCEIQRDEVRRAAGFLERMVKADEPPTTTMPAKQGTREPDWQRENSGYEKRPWAAGDAR